MNRNLKRLLKKKLNNRTANIEEFNSSSLFFFLNLGGKDGNRKC